jgi:hydroxymethylpyrimidine pyrophosphatase-like HAD family hydrolase
VENVTLSTCRLFVFTDLDDTLFKSAADIHCGLSITATVDASGETYARSSVQQQKLLEIMVASGGLIIPVTGRSTRSFLNCKLPDVINSQFAIVSHGAVILDAEHSLLKDWHTYLKCHFDLVEWENKLIKICDHLNTHFKSKSKSSAIRVRLIVDQGITAYVCIKISKSSYTDDVSTEVNHLLSHILETEMLLHSNGRNFAILPPYAQKKVAVDFLKAKMKVDQRDTVFGMGDSHSDLPFMSESDFLIVPGGAQILNEAK